MDKNSEATQEPPYRYTFFAVTGVPNKNGRLTPIYEDISKDYFHAIQGITDTSGQKKTVSFGNVKEAINKEETFEFGHDYGEIDPAPSDQSNNKKARYKNNSFPKSSKHNRIMLHDMKDNRLRMHRHSEPYGIGYGYVKQESGRANNKERVGKTNNSAGGDDISEYKCKEASETSDEAIIRKSSLYTYEGLPDTIHTKTPAFNTEVVGPEKIDTTRRYQKLEPEPPRDHQFWCPAEQKIKMRCFTVCFVCIVILAVVFFVLIVGGWSTLRDIHTVQSNDSLNVLAGELLRGKAL